MFISYSEVVSIISDIPMIFRGDYLNIKDDDVKLLNV